MTVQTARRREGPAGRAQGARLAARLIGAGAVVTLAAVGFAAPVQAHPGPGHGGPGHEHPAPGHPGAKDTFQVRIKVQGPGKATGAGKYKAGDTVTLTATGGKHDVWAGWTSEELNWIGARVDSFTMPAHDVTLTTSFRHEIRPLKDVYRDYFDVGNIWSHPGTYAEGSPNDAVVGKHINVMTAENAMKPDQLLPNDNIDPETGEFTFRWEQADQFVDESLARGIKVHGHVLVWHGQSPPRLNSGETGGTREQARANMERYIKEVLTHFKGRTVSWDVVNEAFVDGLDEFDPETQDWRDFLRGGPNGGWSNWYNAYRNGGDLAEGESPADFLYDAFVFARTYDPQSRLEYNDFNVFQSEGKAQAIIAMATDLNERYAAEHLEDPRPLVEAIGMQSHNYINQTPAFACSSNTRLPKLVNDAAPEWKPGACSDHASVERSLQLITEAGFKASISELDLQVWEAWNGQPEGDDRSQYRDLNDPTVADRISRDEFTYWVGKISNRAELEAIQAQRFAEYFAVYKKYSSDINRVTFWGLNDQLSWRSTHNPLLFNSDWSEKLGAAATADPEKWLGVKGQITDTSALERAVAQAEGINLDRYTPASAKKVTDALKKAEHVLRKGEPQRKVDEATAALTDAIAKLVRRS